ncbi:MULTISPECIES: GNAT family N-acetyltransferase [Hyphomonas]|uniref:Acetyltransferase n=2 Tax=Hyphomonas adhaerens TaxID=81029 RepID=A0A069E298_9PROT|nr:MULTISPECIES: GNAT family N-acetyltransferase [Hyphomonas]KCZ83713.1 acetyltransferase [Hyphomonas adhaerens MHS-3]MBB40100.1 N-acetyltransferase [Hyphomonas sp.]HAE28007.1 N-acetyltransferase [Hyphomonas adhaerens]|tara:strand:- start:102 stop:638 length:537 start_codon:yes stop_codon:yes gene_type:complete
MSFETPQSLLFRDAVPDDVAALTALARKTFTDKFGHLYNPDDLAAFLEESHNPDLYRDWIADPDVLVRVCEADGGDIVAYLLCSPLSLPAPDPEPGALELKRVYVDGRLQGRGTGSRFIDEALAWARERSAPEMYLSVYSGNLDAQRLYDRLGWEKVAEFLFPVGRHRDLEYLLRLKL